jgi:hypothetical protein
MNVRICFDYGSINFLSEGIVSRNKAVPCTSDSVY